MFLSSVVGSTLRAHTRQDVIDTAWIHTYFTP